VSNNIDSYEQRVIEIHIHRGVMTTRTSTVKKTTYTINNVDAKPKTLILEHELTPTFKILNQKPIEVTGRASRFEVQLQPAASQIFPVIEEQVLNNELAVSNQNIDSILEYERNKALTDAGRRAIEQLAALKRQIAENGEQAKRVKDRIDTIAVDEERIRKNLESLNRVSGQQDLVQKYAGQLALVETEMAGLRDQQGTLARKSTELTAAIDDEIEKMDF
jgi:predicted  nucleic acid-binding Zn-ribbon protein